MNKKYRALFKANDIRGIYGDSLDEGITYRIGQALATLAQQRQITRIAVGRDGRLSSPAIAAALIEGLTDAGLTVIDIGLAPTPALYYAAVTAAAGNGVMVTGSHNPKDYNGMKMMLGGKVVMGDTLAALRALALESTTAANTTATPGKTISLNVLTDYIAAVAAACPLSRPLKVVLDAGNGAAGEFAPALFRALGCEITPLFCDIDGNFPNHHPDPAQPQNLRDAAAALASSGGDLALAFDGDGDRLGLIPAAPASQPPAPLTTDRLLMLYAQDLLQRQPGARVVFDVKCSALLAPWITKHGGTPDMQPTGHAFIKTRMANTGALLGGEMSGHFYFKENWYGFDDALFAAARAAAIVSATPPASPATPAAADLFAALPQSVTSPELHITMQDQHSFMQRLASQTGDNLKKHFPAATGLVDIDGMRVEYAHGFGLVRASNTTPALVLRFESTDAAGLEAIKADFRRLLTAADSTLPINF